MPIYRYKCSAHGVFETLAGMTIQRIPCPVCSKLSKKVFSTDVAVLIPAYMRAAGSVGSSEDQCDKQAAYLKSDRHRQQAAKNEQWVETQRIREEKIANMPKDLEKRIEKKLEARR